MENTFQVICSILKYWFFGLHESLLRKFCDMERNPEYVESLSIDLVLGFFKLGREYDKRTAA